VGLEMALAAVRSGRKVTLIERGSQLCWNVLSWGHVTLFSPNRLNMSSLGCQVLKDAGADIPREEEYLTGHQYVQKYLKYLQNFLINSADCDVLLSSNVVSVGRDSLLKGSKNRQNCKFRILIETSFSGDKVVDKYIDDADIVVDATGTYGNHNNVGLGGLPAVGERKLAGDGSLFYTIPDILNLPHKFSSHDRNNPRHTLVVGSGASSVTCLSLLSLLSREVGGVEVTWLTRKGRDSPPYTVIEQDELPQREALYTLGNSLAGTDHQSGLDGFRYIGASGVSRLERTEGGRISVRLRSIETGLEEEITVDTVIAAVGYRPDTNITQELQIHYCYASEGPMKLAVSLLAGGGGGGDCLAQVAPGDDSLLSPEPGLFILGMKSYGRASAFLLRLGHQQVEAVTRILQRY